jgi:hypothetical protein
MPRSKKPRTELIRVSPQMDLEALDLLIQKRVAEASASQGAILEPWFQSPAVSAEIRRHQSIFQQRKWALYYGKWGCIVCGTKERPHSSRGFCARCQANVVNRLIVIEKEYAEAHSQEYENQRIEGLTSRIRNAERILGTVQPMDSDDK